MKKALLITYYWPPSGGAGVHRWLRMSKYFSENEIELTVYCPENPAYLISDEELTKQVNPDLKIIKRKILEPNQFLKSSAKGAGFASDKKQSILTNLFIWIRGNVFIPDARMAWIKSSRRFLKKYLKENPDITTIISTGPPHSMHLIARGLKRNLGLNWIADFRDPWSGIDFADDLKMSNWAKKKNVSLEKSVLLEADHVITVSSGVAEELNSLSGRSVEVITNGFEFDFNFNFKSEQTKDFTIAHFGSMPKSRNPIVLWEVLSEMTKKDDDFRDKLKIELYGNADVSVIDFIEKVGLKKNLEIMGNLTHGESILRQRQMQILLLVVNNTGNIAGTLTGKFFEYVNSKRPIVAIGPKTGDLDNAMQYSNSGQLFEFNDDKGLAEYLQESFEKYKKNGLGQNEVNVDKFETSVLAKRVCELIS